MNLKTLWQNKRMRAIAVVIGVALVAGAAFVFAGATDDSPGWLPAPFRNGGDATVADGESPNGSGDKATAPGGAKPVANANTDDGGDSGDAPVDPGVPDSGIEPPTTDPAPTDPKTDDPSAARMTLRIMYWNDTKDKPPVGLKIVVGDVVWLLSDTKLTEAVGKLQGLPIGSTLTLVVYPDGAGGKKIEVPIQLTQDMISDSEGDAVHVEIKDATVRVLGTPVDNFDVTQDRF